MSDELQKFYLEVESEITDRARMFGAQVTGEFREMAFTEIVAEELEVAGILEAPAVRHFEGGAGSASMKVNAYSVPDEDSRLDVIITVYKGPAEQLQTINASEVDVAFNKLERFFVNARRDLHAKLDPALDPYRIAEHIQSLNGKIDRLNLFLFTNAKLAIRQEKRRKAKINDLPAIYEIWDLERFRRLRESGTSYESLQVDLKTEDTAGLAAVQLDPPGSDLKTWVTVFPATVLAELYEEYGSRLLELNVRSYLQARGKVNKGILETLRDNPTDFVAYNNGITVVAEKVITSGTGDSRIIRLEGMQIVNGGQTTASIHRAGKELGVDLSKVFVQAKITVVEPARFQEIVPLISRYSNTQNKISTADLSANHVFHVGMERVSRREWTPDQKTQWFYERARGSYQTAKSREGTTPARRRQFEERYPVNQRFTKEDLAKFENAWRGEPHWLSRGAQKNFVHFMDRIESLPDGWEPSVEEFHRYIAKAILFREVQRIVRANDVITAYRINVSGYTTALLAERSGRRIDLGRIWNEQKVSPGLVETIQKWAPVIFKNLPVLAQQSGKHVEESFKNQACWDYIRSLDLQLSPKAQVELLPAVNEAEETYRGTGGRRSTLKPEDHNNIALCKERGESDWQKIATWGQQSGLLKDWQRGVARTLAGYAAENWVRSPSVKQARHGKTMIEEARKYGVLDK